ncbi:hypothetical protein CHS0354_012585 [Potamilus streckersoni]|uniref:Uncharacterized protein n=1 Tax=Potamilus streckersoni TaxID=2493646 RepID=A0AAE0W3B2_9BIVA|nr:hypothetical protein CHS0354_012585 [Potamilus streckersoni]
MSLHNLWNIFICLLISSGLEGRKRFGDDIDVMDTRAGQKFILRTWSLIGANLSVSLKVGKITRLKEFFIGDENRSTSVQYGSLVVKYNFTSKEVSLMLKDISRRDEGLYKLEENVNRTKPGSSIDFERKDDTWSFQLNVIEPDEVDRGNVGDDIILEFEKSSEISTLYHYEQIVAHLVEYDCAVWTNTQFYGRLSCTNDNSNKKNRIVIQNVTQRDVGLYKVVHDTKESRRRFLEIKDRPIFACIGENVRIGWFYKELGQGLTLRVLHPNKEVIMIKHPNNSLQIKNNFQQRVSDFGNMSNYVSFTLLNVKSSDSGFYTIETLHGNIMSGQKQLIVQEI